MAEFSNTKLLKIIENIISDTTSLNMQNLFISNNTLYRKTMIDKFPDFSMSYPGLFNTIIDNPKGFDMKRLHSMLGLRDKIRDNKVTHEEASTQIGQQYYDEYVKPRVNESS